MAKTSFWSSEPPAHLRVTCPKCELIIESPTLVAIYGDDGLAGHETTCPRCGPFSLPADPLGDGPWPHLRRSWCPHCRTWLHDPAVVRLEDGVVELSCHYCGQKHSRRPNDPASLPRFPPDLLRRARQALPPYDESIDYFA
jgi:RNase P subunit RPR2